MFAKILRTARSERRAIGAFTCYDLWQLHGVLAASKKARAPVIVLVSQAVLASIEGPSTIAAFNACIRASGVRALLQADHIDSLADVSTAWRCGMQAVLADGSRLAFDENAAFARRAREIADSHIRAQVGIEAELGRIDGGEDRVTARAAGKLTEPDEVPLFLEQSQADCLAVSVGNRHGRYDGPPDVDWGLLTELGRVSAVPLALHGASGLSPEHLRRALSCGVAKLNFNTELRSSYFETAETLIPSLRPALDLIALGTGLSRAVSIVVASKLSLLGWP